MKSAFLYALGLIFSIVMLAALPLEGEAALYDSVIRLHVLAASDTEQDQAVKLAVRDAILETYGEALAAESEEAAAARVEALLPAIEATANATLATHGVPHTAKVSFTEESYPVRVYGDLTFPAGVYHSLRVVIGEGEGQNWWCVLFPPLCLGAATEETPITPDSPPEGLSQGAWQIVSRSGEYALRFALLECFR